MSPMMSERPPIAWLGRASLLRICALLASLWLGCVPAYAQTWIDLTQQAVDSRSETHTIELPDNTRRTLAVRIQSSTRPLSIRSVTLVYASGRTDTIPGPIVLVPGIPSMPLGLRELPLVVSEVILKLEAIPDGGVADVLIAGHALPDLPAQRRATGKQYVEVGVNYVTTRALEGMRSKNSQPLASFGGAHASVPTVGQALVTVPTEGREPGSIPRPMFDFLLQFRKEDPNAEFTVASVKVLGMSEFLAGIGRQSAEGRRFKGQAFVFIHGFNVTFDDALYHTAQLAFDIGFDGAPILFSWASRGNVLAYLYDREQARSSAMALKDLLAALSARPEIEAINIVAHSMGNEPLIQVLHGEADVLRAGGKPSVTKLREVAFASPDVGRDVFSALAGKLGSIVRGGNTLYASSKDIALTVSGAIVNPMERAGFVARGQSPVIVAGVETIDMSEASWIFGLNHSTFSERRHLIDDLTLLFEDGKHPPHKRFVVFRPIEGPAGMYWKYK